MMHDDDHFLPFVYYISWWVLVDSSQIGSRESAEKVRRGENVGTRTVHPALIAEGQRAEMFKKKKQRSNRSLRYRYSQQRDIDGCSTSLR